MNPIELDFPIPEDYRRDFYLGIGKGTMKMEFRGNKIRHFAWGDPGKHSSGEVLDWMAICVMTVKAEFGRESPPH